LDESGGLTGTGSDFYLPTSGFVNGASNWDFAWTINWGDGVEMDLAGMSDIASGGIAYGYSAPGQYQITIHPTGAAAEGWLNAFGYDTGNSIGANEDNRKAQFLSIDTPLTNLGRTQSLPFRFANMFVGARNAVGIPENLFANISTTGVTDCKWMFRATFHYFASNSVVATIPPRLFDAVDSSSCVYLSNMFGVTFDHFASNSAEGTIPATLLGALDISHGEDFESMFDRTFKDYANRTATFKVGGATVGTQSFAAPYATKNISR
jgi:hypothetical protein